MTSTTPMLACRLLTSFESVKTILHCRELLPNEICPKTTQQQQQQQEEEEEEEEGEAGGGGRGRGGGGEVLARRRGMEGEGSSVRKNLGFNHTL